MMQRPPNLFALSLWLCTLPTVTFAEDATSTDHPNIVFVLTDDQRWDTIAQSGNELIRTPNLDRITRNGTHFRNAFVTLAICSPSRAACLTGRYGSSNGVTSVRNAELHEGEATFAKSLSKAGYATGVTGKWHLRTTPQECGFDFASTCWSNGTWYDRKFTIEGETKIMSGFVDDVVADESIRFIRDSLDEKTPFVLWMCTQAPHMDHEFKWPAKDEYLDHFDEDKMPLAKTWQDDLAGKPEYLKTSRNRTRAIEYGYEDASAIRKHTRDYYASVEQMDAAIGRVLDELQQSGIADNTWIIFMGDNGWMLGEHGMTSKVLPYEESMRVPMAIRGPNGAPGVVDDLVLNIDLTATIYAIAGVDAPRSLHGRSLLPLVSGKTPSDWRKSFLYEAPTPQLGSKPLWAVRDARWKYVETRTGEDPKVNFAELYDLEADPIEQTNIAGKKERRETADSLRKELYEHLRVIGVHPVRAPITNPISNRRTKNSSQVRTDIHIKGNKLAGQPQSNPRFGGIDNPWGLGKSVGQELPDPDDKPAAHDKPVKIFILLGQSNMLGFGRPGPADVPGTLEYMTKKKKRYPYLVNDHGGWTTRQDVRYVHVMDKRGVPFDNLDEFAEIRNQWLTVNGNFGPEIGFGHIMGHIHEQPVLILKACIGNRSLGWDLLPPGSKRYEFAGKTYAGYKDNPGSWVEGEPKKTVPWYAGRQYDADTAHAKAVLKNLGRYYPNYQGQGYEVTGFVFWQGHKDQNAAHASRYEQNLVRLIKTLREDFRSPDAKFVLATIAFDGKDLSGHGLQVADAQLAVSSETGRYPEFQGNVKTIDARPFWRDKSESPNGQGYHYNHNAETYMEVGIALGWAMAELLTM